VPGCSSGLLVSHTSAFLMANKALISHSEFAYCFFTHNKISQYTLKLAAVTLCLTLTFWLVMFGCEFVVLC
jgi:hypothetical protein